MSPEKGAFRCISGITKRSASPVGVKPEIKGLIVVVLSIWPVGNSIVFFMETIG